ncbi:MAG: hypothetical protein Q8P86_02040 [bacterium]|nr:hypothetical protein [bacterium]
MRSMKIVMTMYSSYEIGIPQFSVKCPFCKRTIAEGEWVIFTEFGGKGFVLAREVTHCGIYEKHVPFFLPYVYDSDMEASKKINAIIKASSDNDGHCKLSFFPVSSFFIPENN